MTYFEKKMEENENGTEQEHCRFFYKKLTKIEWLLLYNGLNISFPFFCYTCHFTVGISFWAKLVIENCVSKLGERSQVKSWPHGFITLEKPNMKS